MQKMNQFNQSKHRYHIHVTSEDKKAPKGWKLTSIILEKRKIIQEHNMFTRTYVGTSDVKEDVNNILHKFSKMFSGVQRFKVELLDEPEYVHFYTDINYREIHIKCKIHKDYFPLVKMNLKRSEDLYGFALSNNPKEQTLDYVTQFVNVRYKNISVQDANVKLDKILGFLRDNSMINVIEVKEELSVLDTNFNVDKWWANGDLLGDSNEMA